MRPSWRMIPCWLGLLVVTGLRADIPGPGPRYRPGPPVPTHKENAVPLVVEARPDVQQARLIIPRPLLERTRPAQVGATRFWALPVTVVAMSFALGGLCLLRGRVRLGAATLLILVGVAAVSASRNRAVANPPPPLAGLRLPTGITVDDANVEVVAEGDAVRLLLPPALVARLVALPEK